MSYWRSERHQNRLAAYLAGDDPRWSWTFAVSRSRVSVSCLASICTSSCPLLDACPTQMGMWRSISIES